LIPARRLAENGRDPHIYGMLDSRAQSEAGDAAAGLARLAVTRLSLTDFRCYPSARLDLDPRPVVLTGPNGAGKTNLLEALSFLTPGRGLRRSRLSEIDRRQPRAETAEGPWAVAASVATPQGEVRIGTGRDAASESGERRLVRIDGVPAKSQAVLAAHVNLVWLTPQMDRLFLEGASARRRFLDRLVFGFDPDHAGRVAAYEHAMRERNRLLRNGPADASWLAALEDGMSRHGVAIAAARRDTAERLDAAAAEGVGPFPRPRLTLAGTVETWLDEGAPALAVEDRLRERLVVSRRQDAESGTTAAGPHRTDLMVEHGGTGMAAGHCSTGEQKALLIAILLAHARLQTDLHGAPPLMLLDEVAAHLDVQRRSALFGEIEAMAAQAWLTGTDESLFAPLDGKAQFFGVADAVVTWH
jgi:DNA replication and repair protein RecF